MHFVLVNTEFGMNGAAVLLFRWGRHLAETGFRVTAVHNQGASGPLRELYLAAGIALTHHFTVSPNMVVVCNTVMTAPEVLKISPHAPTIWWLHEAETGLAALAAHPEYISAFAAASAIIIPSVTVRDRIYRSFLLDVPEQRVHVVPPGLEPPDPDETNSSVTRGDGGLQIVCVGAITPLKRQSDLIRAVASLPELPIECVMVGRTVELESDAVALTEQFPERFRFVGEVPNAEAMRIVSAADVLSHPSVSECLPLVPLEAGLRSKPLILSDILAHEGIWRHGSNCLMHPRTDPRLLAHMLRILATDPALRADLGQAARRTAAAFRKDFFLARLGMVVAGLARPAPR